MPTFDALSSTFDAKSIQKPAFSERGPGTSPQNFASKLNSLQAKNPGKTGEKQNEKLREVAGQLVSAAFILPLLAEARSSSMKSDLFGGGFAQDSMQQQLDVKLADRMASSGRFPLTDALVRQFTQKPNVQSPEVARFA